MKTWCFCCVVVDVFVLYLACFHHLWPEFGFLSHQAALYLAPQHRDCLKMRHSGVNVLDFYCHPIYHPLKAD